MAKKGSFNWTGITENPDGSFSAKGKIEKRRLLKSLHDSGYKVRSTRNADNSWTVSAIGTLARPTKRSLRSQRSIPVRKTRGEPQTIRRISPRGRYVRLSQRTRPLRRIPIPTRYNAPRPGGNFNQRRYFTEGGLPRAPSFMQNYLSRRQQMRRERMESQRQTSEINQKMRTERIQAEQQNARNVRQQIRQQAIQSGSHVQKPYVRENQNIKTSYPPSKIDRAQLQTERENQVT